jgi:ketosteroid isomerase-like protein
MEAMGGSPEIELVLRCFQALGQGDFGVLEASLAEDARWRTVEEGRRTAKAAARSSGS